MLDIWYRLLRVTPESQRPFKPYSHVQVSEKTSENKTLKGILGLILGCCLCEFWDSVFLVVINTTLDFEHNANQTLREQAAYFPSLVRASDAEILVIARFLYWKRSSALSGISKYVILHHIHRLITAEVTIKHEVKEVALLLILNALH